MPTRSLYLLALLSFSACAEPDAPSTASGDTGEMASLDRLEQALATDEAVRAGLGALALPLDEALGSLALRHGLDPDRSLLAFLAETDELGITHIRVQQHVGAVPVWGGEAIVHLDEQGGLHHATDALADGPQVDTIPAIGADTALSAAIEAFPEAGDSGEEPLLYVLPFEGGHRLAWQLRLVEETDEGMPLSRPVVFVDAHDGSVLWDYDDLRSGTGLTHFNGSVGFPTTYSSYSHAYSLASSQAATRTANGTFGSGSLWLDFNDIWDGASQRSGVSAHWAVNQTLNYLLSRHGYLGVDNLGTQLNVVVDYGTGYNNAHGGGTTLQFGNGDGSFFGPFTTLDIVAHEIAHCITDYNARLIYSGESGGLNESFSDVIGAIVESWVDGSINADTWLIGEDSFTPATAGDALRYMNDPARDGASLDFYTSAAAVGAADVHHNSGIGNLAFSLLANGGAHPRRGGVVVSSAGMAPAASTWFRAFRYYMTSSSDYADARSATIIAASDLYGASSSVTTSVKAAWEAVGVSGTDCQSGFLSGPGDGAYLPNGTYFWANAGTHHGELMTGGGVDAGLYLYQWNGSAWQNVAASSRGAGDRELDYTGTAGWYLWYAYDWSGAASYEACIERP